MYYRTPFDKKAVHLALASINISVLQLCFPSVFCFCFVFNQVFKISHAKKKKNSIFNSRAWVISNGPCNQPHISHLFLFKWSSFLCIFKFWITCATLVTTGADQGVGPTKQPWKQLGAFSEALEQWEKKKRKKSLNEIIKNQ